MKIAQTLKIVNILLIVQWKHVTTVTLLPHGTSHPDDIDLSATDESTAEVPILQPLIFFGNTYSSIWIASNGFIGFGAYTDCCFPILAHNNPMIAPLWDDWVPGILYYRQTTTDATDLDAATAYVRSIYPDFSTFEATWALVATWSYFILWFTGNQFAHFQTILTSDGTNSFAVFLYERIDGVNAATAVVDAGDGTNYYMLCGGVTDGMADLPLMKQTCTSEPGVFAFRIDSNNPDQANYDCTSTLISAGDPKASYFCRWSDAAQTSLDMTFILTKPNTCGITAWDTTKFNVGDDPSLTDPACQTLYTQDPTTLSFSIDPTAATPACGASVNMYTPLRYDITIRAYCDATFETVQDRIYKISCDRNEAIPATIEVDKEFDGIDLSPLPPITRTLQLLVIAPDTSQVLTRVEIGQWFQLRIIYDNTATNIDPYGVYIDSCTVADTSGFDVKTFQFIKSGCVVEQNVDDPWYMTRSFQETSLSPAGLFISDSGYMRGAKFTTQNKIFLRCQINFCFFTASAPNKCTDSCTGGTRRKRSINETNTDSRAVYTSVTMDPMKDENMYTTDTPENQPTDDCVDKLSVLLTTTLMGFFTALNTIFAFILFRKITRQETIK